MGTYYIPRNLKGESRILYIFTAKSLMTTAIGGGIGVFLYFIFAVMGIKVVGIIIAVLFALIGYGIGAIKIPDVSGFKITKNIGGEPLSEIILRYIKFKKDRKIYIYTEEKEDNK